MSARQRHSRITTSDGWTTITSSSRKDQGSDKQNKKKKKKKGYSEDVTEKKPSAAVSALLAHKSDLNLTDDAGQKSKVDKPIDQAELAKVTARLEKHIETFNTSECCQKLKDLVQRELGIHSISDESSVEETSNESPVEKTSDESPVKRISDESPVRETSDKDTKASPISNILILALGSISESFKPAPSFQLAAILSLLPLLTHNNKTKISIISYDPVYTPIDVSILNSYDISTIPASQIPTDESWYENALVYMPHASVWLNHKYFILKPRLWIGNKFEIYEDAAAEGSEVSEVLDEARKVRQDQGYEVVDWPEDRWGDGMIFNNLAVYVRRRKVKQEGE